MDPRYADLEAPVRPRLGRDGLPDVPRSPTGRVPQWVLDEATGRAPQRSGWRSAPTYGGAGPRGRRRRRRRTAALGVGCLALLAGIVAVSGAGVLPDAPDGAVPARSGPGPRQGAPARPAEHAPASGAGWMPAHLQRDGTTPIAWDPCRPVHVVMRPDGAPPGAEALLTGALDEVAAATGLRFVYDGVTDEAPSAERAPLQPERYGNRWAPVLVVWSTPAEEPEMRGLGGRAAPRPVTAPDGAWVYVSGTVELNATVFGELLAAPGSEERARAIVLHEFGHVVGLGHVEDPGQLMHASGSEVVTFGPGDLAGLAELGRGECVPVL
ncbi:matrixin [Kineococcus xinjiangensis]|uniref:Matrixin n=1 Tax=Kineococcus xinjiangensis TaxID=512762 RepID=A0A2S6IDY7_9ACTN|nr:matrixin family metalloprotease [Kineococcus xinjiangensis]PPK92434.1 matrixin [Kineococcus xinjiangensis]